MATPLDLQEQEQLDAIKSFWKQYGNLITWTLILVLGAFAAWNGWNWYQRDQGIKAGAMFDELDEGTAIFKTRSDPPVGASRFLAEPGLAPDHYLRLAGSIGKLLRGEIPETFPGAVR